MITKSKKTVSLLLALLWSAILSAQSVIRGKTISAADGNPISFAGIYAKETGKGVVSDIGGNFTLVLPKMREVHLRVSCMGYHTAEMTIKPTANQLIIRLEEQSFCLQDVTVTAKLSDKMGSDATIEQETLQYIQPTSLKDIFVLLPGGKMGNNNIQNNSLISSRQAGSDMSTSFGMGLSINGVPMQNDGMRIQMSGLTGNASADNEGNVVVNTGMDFRSISTDHIESITLARGISSAKEGNLSSGTIRVKAKQGRSPLQVRMKFDPLNKLAYVGKGIYLSDQLGTLYAGADIMKSQSRIEDSRGAYNRVSGQLNWNNQYRRWGRTVDMNIMVGYVTSFSNNKTDEIIKTYHEKYNSRYQRASFSGKINMALNPAWIDNLELIVSADYTQSLLKHNKYVINRTVMPLQQNRQEGESEGIYLPSAYNTFYKIDNQPLNFFTQLNVEKVGNFSNNMSYNLLLGSSLNYTKNIGQGAVVDPQRPPFPSEEFIRPRKNSDIPALMNHAAYIESKLHYRQKQHEVNASLGLRETMMLHLPSTYTLNGKLLFEPRMQMAYTFYHKMGIGKMSHTLRVGYGIENKLPSADFLYPDKVYHDFIALNAYFTDESKRLLITNTKIQNPTNQQLSVNKNSKWEAGYDLRWKGLEINLTAFRELMKGGIEYFTTYTPACYNYYYELANSVEGKPTKEDFKSYEIRTFMTMRMPTNSARTDKKGMEYRIHVPIIAAIKSEIEVNGAYYETIYSNGVPEHYRPSIMVGNRIYPYVGIFDGGEKRIASTMNTNLWVNTHLPKWKLIFTNFIQVVWFVKYRLDTDIHAYPEHYMDTYGVIHKFNIENDILLERLQRSYLASRYKENKEPVSVLWNIKATKEFNRHVKLSFFANNIVQLNPKYRNGYAKTQRNWQKPFFGAELTMSF